jgi:hypothetical protein
VDYSHHILGLRLNFFVALVLCIIGLVWFAAIQLEWSAPSWFPRFHPRRRGARPGPAPAQRRGSQKKPGSSSGTRVASNKRSAGKARNR